MFHSVTRAFSLPRVLALAIVLPFLGVSLTQTPRQVVAGDSPSKKAAPDKTIGAAGNVQDVVKKIDESLEAGWTDNKITPSKPADDYEFVRRASLDLLGRIATPEEIEAFLKDPKETRRPKLIDRLLQSEDYPKNWANLWSNWLLTRSGVFGRGKYHDWMTTWLEDQFAKNVSYDKLVMKLITAKGKNDDMKEDGAASNFILAHLGEPTQAAGPGGKASPQEEGRFDMVPLTSRITRLFVGVRTQCTQCHDHPFGKEKQQQFWGINAFLRQVDRKGQPPTMRAMNAYVALELEDNADFNNVGYVFYEKRSGLIEQTKPRFLDGTKIKAAAKNRRQELADLMLDHPNFPKAIVNRMWGHFFGVGFVNPIDDFHEQNPPSNPELLEELGKQFKHYNYDMKMLIRWICNSRAYGLSSVANKTNAQPDKDTLFSHMLLKAMSPEQLFESLMVACKLQGADGATDRKTLKDQWLATLVRGFGDDEGNEVNFNGTIVQALIMMNGKDINDAIARKDTGTVAKIMHKKSTTNTVYRDLYLAALNRPPTEKERHKIQEAFKQGIRAKDSVEAQMQDLFWALLNSNEFILNH